MTGATPPRTGAIPPETGAVPPDIARETTIARTRWLDPAWRTEALTWVEAALAHESRRITGEVAQPHIRPWSTVLSIPTDGGLVWFKAGGPGNRHEAALLDALAGWETPGILRPLRVDVERGWLLLPDGGPRLRETLDGGPGIGAWERVLGEWAAIQRRLESRANELVAAGVPDLRPERLADQLERLLVDSATPLAPADRDRLRAFVPTYAAWCTDLTAIGIAPSLQHDDLHDGNVFVGPEGDRLFDWGDASVSHPFGTLLVTFRSIANRGFGDDAAARGSFGRLRDAYLEPWTDEHGRAELDEAVELAVRAAVVGRALSWERALTGIPVEDHGEWRGAVGDWLLELFEQPLL